MLRMAWCFMILTGLVTVDTATHADEFQWELRTQKSADGTQPFLRSIIRETWSPKETAFIVCDVWDKHHCLNAVRRLEEFAPRLNQVLSEARRRGAIIIHSPSDCMPAYDSHPARKRAIAVPQSGKQPKGVAEWCSRIPSEERAAYPIDQSDGGEDDDPIEHREWVAELTALGRNPGMPWKTQSPMLSIDADHDFISDRGDEVWNILHHHGIKNVVLTGVHTNMCVLGRPFGLRQMVRNGFHVVLMRDMTDCMYNPKRWPYVDHFTGNDLVISHIERFVCATVTSDQILGGTPFRFQADNRTRTDIVSVESGSLNRSQLRRHWCVVDFPATWSQVTAGEVQTIEETVWYRAALIPGALTRASGGETLAGPEGLNQSDENRIVAIRPEDETAEYHVWINGLPAKVMLPNPNQQQPNTEQKQDARELRFALPSIPFESTDAVLLVVRVTTSSQQKEVMSTSRPPTLETTAGIFPLRGHWQVRFGDDASWSNMPLPAKFGVPTDIVIAPNAE